MATTNRTLNLLDKVDVTISFSKQDIWNALTCSDFAGLTYWVHLISDKNGYGIGDEITDIYITHTEPTTGDLTKAVITTDKIFNAFAQLVIDKETHCGNYSLADLDDSDSCFADYVLQYALFGKLIFG